TQRHSHLDEQRLDREGPARRNASYNVKYVSQPASGSSLRSFSHAGRLPGGRPTADGSYSVRSCATYGIDEADVSPTGQAIVIASIPGRRIVITWRRIALRATVVDLYQRH